MPANTRQQVKEIKVGAVGSRLEGSHCSYRTAHNQSGGGPGNSANIKHSTKYDTQITLMSKPNKEILK